LVVSDYYYNLFQPPFPVPVPVPMMDVAHTTVVAVAVAVLFVVDAVDDDGVSSFPSSSGAPNAGIPQKLVNKLKQQYKWMWFLFLIMMMMMMMMISSDCHTYRSL
jgi:preprotein translocase subunit SecG